MSPRLQALLLRFTETGEVQPVGADRPRGRSDARLVTATHRDLRARIDAGAFEEEICPARLNVIQLHIPALRDRGDDVRILLHHFLAQAAVVHRRPIPALPAKAEARLLAYEWPGNVRELKNVAERLVINGGGTALILGPMPGGRRRQSGTERIINNAELVPTVVCASIRAPLAPGECGWSAVAGDVRRDRASGYNAARVHVVVNGVRP